MPFGLTNAPATCQRFVNDTLREFLDVFCVCYLDDILIYSDNVQDHRKQVQAVLEKLHGAGSFVKLEKCKFEANKTTFLGFVISHDGMEIHPEKVSAVNNWEITKTIQDVQCLLGFANFHRRFIKGYSRICTPLFNLIKTVDKDTSTPTVTTNPAEPVKKKTNKEPIEWIPRSQEVFDELKTRFCSAPFLETLQPYPWNYPENQLPPSMSCLVSCLKDTLTQPTLMAVVPYIQLHSCQKKCHLLHTTMELATKNCWR